MSAILAAVLFSILSFAAKRQAHIIDQEGWGHPEIAWGAEPVDMGTPSDILLLLLNLPALIALLPLLPLTYWVDSEMVLRAVWGLGAIAQWFVIGRHFDIRRGLLLAGAPSRRLLLRKVLVNVVIAAGGLVFAEGFFSAVVGRHSVWALIVDASFLFWGMLVVIIALRWRSAIQESEHLDLLPLS